MLPGRFPNVPESMWNFGWNPQSMGLHGQFCGGDPMVQQSQAQAQAQVSALQQQNAMLNQHLHTQAQTHINHLQQLLPYHQPPQPPPSTPSPAPATQPTVPPAPDPPAPLATPANQPGSSGTFNPDEMLQQMKFTVESSFQAIGPAGPVDGQRPRPKAVALAIRLPPPTADHDPTPKNLVIYGVFCSSKKTT